jgi:hypothetical protein
MIGSSSSGELLEGLDLGVGILMLNGWQRFGPSQCWCEPMCLVLFEEGEGGVICLHFLTVFHRE